ncbi:KamA family radical SAM protein [Hippea maritima]|uniref:Lysine 2,3-aminomutase n=1 Tax=Hippea maritima (strain ATCC 700847 / DSM 10411 / MH2) TaxID=760142 RepID=F2LWU8_HIPMA|nr:KamA family radical SAM protein [Hippea maritima]AEA33076.1 Lysine 2,3-aminomutase [Hippea maritima DSM 10411]
MSVKLNNYLCGIIHKKGIKSQFCFSKGELFLNGNKDPLGEKKHSKAKGLIHRYTDRVVLTVTNKCFAYCRFCFRKNNWQSFEGFSLEESVNYLKKTKNVREVLISGGDPFFLSNKKLAEILTAIRSIKHISTIRIGSRVLSSLPIRIDNQTAEMLKLFKPIWIAAHINHPDEITDEFKKSARLLLDSGIPIVSQTVLLKNINDNETTLKKLFCSLVDIGIKPYYLFGCDQAVGNGIFRVSIDKALSLMEKLRGKISGLCMPTFSFDLPSGYGKVTLEPNRIIKRNGNIFTFKNFEGKEINYTDV